MARKMRGSFANPFRPGAGHPPPYLAGRDEEQHEFSALLDRHPVLTNWVLTGLRGVGKTVLLETLKPIAIRKNWLWAGADLSEAATVSEDSLATRLLVDLAPLVAHVVVSHAETRRIGFAAKSEKTPVQLDFRFLKWVYDSAPGLSSDKLKVVLELVWSHLRSNHVEGVVLAYDEAQNLSDQAARHQYPLSLLLDVFQSVQKKEFPFLLVLTGLPTLFPKLVDARTFAERMFRVTQLGRLNDQECREAIVKPIEQQDGPVRFTAAAVAEIIRHSGGYPYFIQFLCREVYDAYAQRKAPGRLNPGLTVRQTIRKLDTDFFAGRWNRVTERQRDLLAVVAQLPNCDEEFTVQEVVKKSQEGPSRPFTASHVTQLLAKLADSGLVYKNRHGRYCFAIPLLGHFIQRHAEEYPTTGFE
jgi:hypothetical protein